MEKSSIKKDKSLISITFGWIIQFFRFFFGKKKNSSKFARWYLYSILFGMAMLYAPFSLKSYIKSDGSTFTLLDALFTATSAFTDTGLVVTQTSTQFTFVGQLIIAWLIILGGIGVIAIKILVLKVLGKAIGLKELFLFQEERGSMKLGESSEVILIAFKTMIYGILIGLISLAPYFYFKQQEIEIGTYKNALQSIWHAFFHSVSAINNAGFDITGASSFAVYANDIWVKLIMVILVIIGGIGFPVIYDVKRFITHRVLNKDSRIFKWSLFTKLTVFTYFTIFIIGSLLAISFEVFSQAPSSLWNKALTSKFVSTKGAYTKFEVINSVIFTTLSTRNAGFSTIPIGYFQETTKMLWSAMMWIGSSPASTAGGIRTTTFAIAFLAIISRWRTHSSTSNRINAFKQRIPAKTVYQSLVVVFSSLVLIWMSVVFIILDAQYTTKLLMEKSIFTFNNVFFEVTSAFGTTGLSAGITPLLTVRAKWVIIILMMIGQVGITAFLSIWSKEMDIKKTEVDLVFGEEDVIIS